MGRTKLKALQRGRPAGKRTTNPLAGLLRIRTERGISRAKLAAMLRAAGVTVAVRSLANWEPPNTTNPPPDVVTAIAKVLRVKEAELFE